MENAKKNSVDVFLLIKAPSFAENFQHSPPPPPSSLPYEST